MRFMSVNISDEQLKALSRNANVTYQNSSRGIVEQEAIDYPNYAELDHSDLSLKGLSMRISSLKSVAKTGNFEDLLFPLDESFKLNFNLDKAENGHKGYLATNGNGKKGDAKHGFMSGEDKYTFDDFFKGNIEHRHELVHRTDPGHKHIPAGGNAGQVLMYKANGEAQWKNHTIYTAGQGVTIKGIGEKDPKDCEILLNFTTNNDEAKNNKDASDIDGSNIGSSIIVPRADHVHDGRYVPASGSTTFNVSSKLKFTSSSNISFDNNVALRGAFDDTTQYKMVSIDSLNRLVLGDTSVGAIALNVKSMMDPEQDNANLLKYWGPDENGKVRDFHIVTGRNIATQHVARADVLHTPRKINGTDFDGSKNITTSSWGTARTITMSDNSKDNTNANTNIDGSGDITLKLPATIKATLKGNADTATTLKTKRKINGTDFDGSGNITTTNWGTARIVKISDGNHGGIESTVNGSENVTLRLPTTITATLDGNASTATLAAKATILETTRKINGTDFNGGKDITTANWGTARNISISDNNGSNSATTNNINGSGNFTLKLPATIKASIDGNASSSTTATGANTVYINGTGYNNYMRMEVVGNTLKIY